VSFMATAMVLAWVAIILLTLAVAGLLRQVHLLLTERAAEGTAVPVRPGAPALPVELIAGGAERIVLFASTSCVACSEVMPVMVEHCRSGDRLCLVVTAAARHPDWPDELVYRENAADLFEHFGIVATPHALRIVDTTVVASGPVGSAAALRALIDGHRHHADAAS
jgi:hypothetical protein